MKKALEIEEKKTLDEGSFQPEDGVEKNGVGTQKAEKTKRKQWRGFLNR